MRRRFDVIGDIAVIGCTVDELEKDTAETILRENKRVRVVLAKSAPVRGAFRLCGLKLVAGENRTLTVHRENGCVFHVDLAAVHFSPRLVNERRLVAESSEPGEQVLNMFGGLGSFSIEIAKEKRSTLVFNVDINPDAARLCLKNVLANSLRGRVVTVLSDAKEATNSLFLNKVGRVLLPLPEKSYEYLNAAISALKDSGTIHYYDFVGIAKRESCVDMVLAKVAKSNTKADLSLRKGRIVKSVAPRRYLVSLELHAKKSGRV